MEESSVNRKKRIDQQRLSPYLIFLIVGVLGATAVIRCHLGDPTITDEAEFYRAAVPQDSLLRFSYYGGKFVDSDSGIQINPSWHPAAYVVLLRAWIVTFGATVGHARLFGVLCLAVAPLSIGFLLVRRRWLTLAEALAWGGVTLGIPTFVAGSMLLDIDGTLLVGLIPLSVIIMADVIGHGESLTWRSMVYVSIIFGVLLLAKIVAAVFLPATVAILLAVRRRPLREWGQWVASFSIGTVLFIAIWSGITFGTDLSFWGPLLNNFKRSGTLMSGLSLGLLPVYVIRDFLTLVPWFGWSILGLTVGAGAWALWETCKKSLSAGAEDRVDVDYRFLFVRVFVLLYGVMYLVAGRSFVYGFPKYFLPLVPLAILMMILDARPILGEVRGSRAWLSLAAMFVVSCLAFVWRGDNALAAGTNLGIVAGKGGYLPKLLGAFRIALPEFLLAVAMMLIVVYLTGENVPNVSHFTRVAFVGVWLTSAYGFGTSVLMAQASGSVTYDYGTSGSGDVVDMLAAGGVPSGTVIGPLEVVYGIKGLQRFISIPVVLGNPAHANKAFSARPLILVSTREVDRRLAELGISGLDRPQRVEVKGSYTVRWYDSD